MKLKLFLLLSSSFVFVTHASIGTTPASISQARAKAYQIADQLESLIKSDAVGNASEISRLEKELQSYVRSFNQSGQNKIATEISLRSNQLQGRKVEADVNDIVRQAQEIRSSTTDDASKARLATLEGEVQQLKKDLQDRIAAVKVTLDENTQLQGQLDAAKQLQQASAQEVDRLTEALKKAGAVGKGAAGAGIQGELDDAREQIRKMKEQQQRSLDESKARERKLQDDIINLDLTVKALEADKEAFRKEIELKKQKGPQITIPTQVRDKIKDLTFTLASETEQSKREAIAGNIRNLLSQ